MYVIISGVQLKIIFPAPDLLSNLNRFSKFECEKDLKVLKDGIFCLAQLNFMQCKPEWCLYSG